jgi:hypothetical protein
MQAERRAQVELAAEVSDNALTVRDTGAPSALPKPACHGTAVVGADGKSPSISALRVSVALGEAAARVGCGAASTPWLGFKGLQPNALEEGKPRGRNGR